MCHGVHQVWEVRNVNDAIIIEIRDKTVQITICYFDSTRLPIEDPFLKAEPALPDTATPFSKIPNPLLAALTFLASAVDPAVAVAGSKAAIESLLHSVR